MQQRISTSDRDATVFSSRISKLRAERAAAYGFAARLMPEVLKTKKYELIGKIQTTIQKENDEKGAPGPRPGTFWTQPQ